MPKEVSLDEQIVQKKKELELLELKKQEALLKLEIEKISKTKVEETIIERRIVKDVYPAWPYQQPMWICGSGQTQITDAQNVAKVFNALLND